MQFFLRVEMLIHACLLDGSHRNCNTACATHVHTLISKSALVIMPCRVLLGMLKSQSHTQSPTADFIQQLVANQDLQMALLNCATELVLDTFSSSMSFPALTAALGRCAAVVDLWEAAEHFKDHLNSSKAGKMPEECESFLAYIRYIPRH